MMVTHHDKVMVSHLGRLMVKHLDRVMGTHRYRLMVTIAHPVTGQYDIENRSSPLSLQRKMAYTVMSYVSVARGERHYYR